MAGPIALRIRAYDVGFGDCFLLTFTYAGGAQRHVLIDFGSTRMPAWLERRQLAAEKKDGRKRNLLPEHMFAVARHIAEACQGKLHVAAATHRHADHISGFAGRSGEVIAGLKPEIVILPWTERRDLAVDATGPARPRSRARQLVAGLNDMQSVAEFAGREVSRLPADVPGTVKDQLGVLGEINVTNQAAVEALRRLPARGRIPRYVFHGSKIDLSAVLPGVTVDVLGPPTPQQYAAIQRQASTDPDEFWSLAASTASVRRRSTAPLFADEYREETIPAEARWVVTRVGKIRAEELLGIVRTLDDALNNTSLVLLFEVGGKLLLFPGDAQVESWRYALKDAPNADETAKRLAKTNVYKVGHHGSLNATPRRLLWEHFANRGDDTHDDRLVTVLSTREGKHGSTRRNTEVPRRTLVTELSAQSTMVTTQDVKAAGSKTPWQDVEIDLTGADLVTRAG